MPVVFDYEDILSRFDEFSTAVEPAAVESPTDICQWLFERYFVWADKWLTDQEWFDPITGLTHDHRALDAGLKRFEPDCVTNRVRYRMEIVHRVHQARGDTVAWDAVMPHLADYVAKCSEASHAISHDEPMSS